MIRGTTVFLRAMEPSDVDLMMIYENDTENWPVSSTISPYSRYTLAQYYENASQDFYAARQMRLAIELITEVPGQNMTIGFIDLFDFDPHHRRAGVGILIGEKRYRRKGFALEALKLMANYSFNTLNLHQIYCHIEMANEASLALFAAAGFKTCGVIRDWIAYDGKWHDVTMMQQLRPRDLV